MSPDFPDIARYASASIRTSLITNGTLISDAIAKDLVNLGAASLISKGLIAIDVSLHGNRQIHNLSVGNNNAYDSAIEGIKRVVHYKKRKKKKYPKLNLRCIVTAHNYTLLKDMLELSKEIGADMCTFGLISYVSSPLQSKDFREGIDLNVLKDQLNSLVERAREYRLGLRFSPSEVPIFEIIRHYADRIDLNQYSCFFPWGRAVVSSAGDFCICPRYSPGNLKQEKFIKLWNNIKSRQFRLHLKKGTLSDDCLGCCGMRFMGR